jgi:sugar/nucleoside kinase (ribokinase family)
MGKKYDVIVVGDYCLDLIFTGLPKLPELGIEIIGTGFEMTPGGTYNTAIALHRLGVHTGWAGDFGTDDFSRLVLTRASEEGFDPSLFVHHDRPLRRITVAASYPEDRAFIAYYDPDTPIPAAVKALAAVSARVLYIPGIYSGEVFAAGLALVRAKKIRLAMDGYINERETMESPSIRKSIQAVDLLMPNASEARRLTGETDLEKAIHILGELCPLVVIKDGPAGALAYDRKNITHSPAIAISPVDTTGAVDCFNAGFIKAWLNDLPLTECLRWGNIVGGLSTLGHGGTGRIVCEEDVRCWLAKD